jgi:two-component system sensor histidine kinase RegB
MLNRLKQADKTDSRRSPSATSSLATDTSGRTHLRLGTITRLRWIAVIGQVITVSFLYWVLDFRFDVGWCLFLIGLSAWLNIALRLVYPSSHLVIAQYAALILGFDLWHLTALLYLTGGLQNPFVFLLLVPVTISASTQFPRITVQLGILAIGCATLLAFFHYPLPWFAHGTPVMSPVYTLGLWVSVVVGITFMAFYSWRIARESRNMSRALAAAELVLAREQKLTALDGLAAAAAHELGTPLSTIVLVAKELRAQCSGNKDIADDLELMRSQAQRCQEILATLSRNRVETDLVHNRMSVHEMLDEIAEPHRAFGKAVIVAVKPAASAKSEADKRQPIVRRNPGVMYGIGNLIENAVDFAHAKVAVDAEWNGREVRVTITDDGPGFAMEILDILGEPYVSSRYPPGADNPEGDGGLGLGFFIAKTLLERSGATIELTNRKPPATGAHIILTWPRDRIELKDEVWYA